MIKAGHILTFGFFIAGLLFFSACSPRTYQVISNWQPSNPPAEPGAVWIEPMGTDKKTGLEYAIGNDNENLFLIIKTKDPVSRMKILRGGLEMDILVPGRENEIISLKYPVPEEKITVFQEIPRTPGQAERYERMGGPGPGWENPADLREMFMRALADQKEMLVKGLMEHPEGLVPLENQDGVHLNVSLSRDEMLEYQFTIPLKNLGETQTLAAGMEREFLAKIKLNALERPARPGGNYGSPGMPGGGGMGGVRPGNPRVDLPYTGRPAGSSRSSAESSRLTKDENIRIAFKLADSP